jgi:hypothetical protein
MWRAIIEPALFFLTPFLAYALFHLAQRRWPFVRELWQGRTLSLLTIAGLVIAILGMITLGLTGLEQGTYIPAHVEDGKLKPGRFQ